MADYIVPIENNFQWQRPVLDKDLTAPPGGESGGERYIVALGATGSWNGNDGKIAYYRSPAYSYITPTDGMICYVEDERLHYMYNGDNELWEIFAPPAVSGQGAWQLYERGVQYQEMNFTLPRSCTEYKVEIQGIPQVDGVDYLFYGGDTFSFIPERFLGVEQLSTGFITAGNKITIWYR
jgi:hypothetical protein